MEPVVRIGPATIIGAGRMSRQGSAAMPDAPSPQRALVRVTPVGPAGDAAVRPADGRATAPFLAHLIATVQGAPQTRERRRVAPNWASAAYAAAMEVSEWAGRAVSESR